MKKVICFLLIAAVMTACMSSAFAAAPTETPTDTWSGEKSLQEKMEAYVKNKYYSYTDAPLPEYSIYEELAEYKDDNGNVEWVMIYTDLYLGGETWSGFALIGNRVFKGMPRDTFRYGMALYDAVKDTFYDMSLLKGPDISTYKGLLNAIDECGKGRLLGDLDNDDELSILDVTIMLRCESGMKEYPENDVIDPTGEIDPWFNPLVYYSDFNRDGERDLLDATCIQRYLAGLPYPIG